MLHVESRGLYDTSNTLHSGREYGIRQTLQRIRDSFEDGDIDILRWAPSASNIADGLPKRNSAAHRFIKTLAVSRRLDLPRHEIYELESDRWERRQR